MQKTRSWQDSFDKLALARREESALREAELRQTRDAESAYTKVRAERDGKAASEGFMLVGEITAKADVTVKPKPPTKTPDRKSAPQKPRSAAKVTKAKTSARKEPGRKKSKPKAAKPNMSKPTATKPRVATPRCEPASVAASVAASPAIVLPRAAPASQAERLLITPLPRNASLAPYRKTGLFGLIGSWLRLAARRAKLPTNLLKPTRHERPPREDVASLKAENEKLRRQLKELLAQQEAAGADTPPWSTAPGGLTTPAGDVPARLRRRGGIRL